MTFGHLPQIGIALSIRHNKPSYTKTKLIHVINYSHLHNISPPIVSCPVTVLTLAPAS